IGYATSGGPVNCHQYYSGDVHRQFGHVSASCDRRGTAISPAHGRTDAYFVAANTVATAEAVAGTYLAARTAAAAADPTGSRANNSSVQQGRGANRSPAATCSVGAAIARNPTEVPR